MDDARILMHLARTRTPEQVPSPELREFLEESVARCHPDAYHRLLEIELMASISYEGEASDFVLERWLEAQEHLDGLLEECGSQEELLAAVSREENARYREDLFVWGLLDRCRPYAETAEPSLDLLAVAEQALLTRLEEEGNPEGRNRCDGTTDLYAMCRAQVGNRLRVRGDATGGFAVVRTVKSFLRPGGNSYATGKVLSYCASIATDAGRFEEARENAGRALDVFQRTNWLAGIGEALNLVYHIDFMYGISSRERFVSFLGEYYGSHRLPEKIAIFSKMNLVGDLVYFHEGLGAEAVLNEIERLSLCAVDRLWVRQYRALLLLQAGRPMDVATEFGEVASGFLGHGLQSHGHYVMLFEALANLDAGRYKDAANKAASAARFFSSSGLYGGLACQAASSILLTTQSKALDRTAILELIEKIRSPAKGWLDGAQKSPTR